MKAINPSKKAMIVFVVLFNLFLSALIFYGLKQAYSWKMSGAILFCSLLIIGNWLPKTPQEMDEREKNIYERNGYFLLNISFVLQTLVFVSHLIFFPQMTVIEFMLFYGLPTVLIMSFKNIKFRQEML
ncbi:MAG: hypothetical protein K2P81_00810 [Bacteriovoracaceae bacterium]|nr:hypothetical protein [Bacteriovoracaceae bacterium]